MIQYHAFIDGNKRIGMLSIISFLKLNGVCINPSDEDIVRIGIGIASGVMTYDESLTVVKNLIQEAV